MPSPSSTRWRSPPIPASASRSATDGLRYRGRGDGPFPDQPIALMAEDADSGSERVCTKSPLAR
jgi:hypothetical protein